MWFSWTLRRGSIVEKVASALSRRI
jgi:hypothetical protein